MNRIKIGLFGYGCVGQGLYYVLQATQGIRAEVVKIAVKDRHKKRSLPLGMFTFDKNEILNNPDIELIVELIDDADEAYNIVKTALLKGKSVVTANKKMLAQHLQELIDIQREKGVSLLYEAAVCGSIPIIRNLEEYYDNDLLTGVYGIFNGSTNYILSKLFNERSDYATALKEAQKRGFAESNPTLDVEAYDPLYKLVIATVHSFGLVLPPASVFHFGISTLGPEDLRYAIEKRKKYKLIAQVQNIDNQFITAFVVPQLIAEEDFLYNVENEYNAVAVEAAFSDKQLLIGKGAGGNPTASAILSDVAAFSHNYKYEYKKLFSGANLVYTTNVNLQIYLRYDSAADLEVLRFNHISEHYDSEAYKYVVGNISLQSLIENKDYLKARNLFFAKI